MNNKSNTLRFRAACLTVCSLLMTAWLPLAFAGSGHDHDSDGGHEHGKSSHDHGHESAPATEAFYPDEDSASKTEPPQKTETHQDDHHHDSHGDGNDHHKH